MFCVLTVATTLNWAPETNVLHAPAQQLVLIAVNSYHSANQLFDDTLNSLHPMASLAKKEEMYLIPSNKYFRAMTKETDNHENGNHWEVILRSEKNRKPILAIWAFKRKRCLDGRIVKWKTRLCAHGGMQTHRVDYIGILILQLLIG